MLNLNDIFERYPFVQRDNLIPILQDIQEEYGYLTEEAIVEVGKFLDMPTAKIYGLATFYNQFRFLKRGKYHFKVCNGTSCHLNSNVLIIKELESRLGIKSGETTKDLLFSLEETNCMASCGDGPVMSVNEKYYTNLTLRKVKEIVDYYLNLKDREYV